MHIAWGKRGSGCDTSSQGTGFVPMMQMPAPYGTEGSRSGMMEKSGNSMMGNWDQNPMWWGRVSSWPVSLLWLVWLTVGILTAAWLWKQIIKK